MPTLRQTKCPHCKDYYCRMLDDAYYDEHECPKCGNLTTIDQPVKLGESANIVDPVNAGRLRPSPEFTKHVDRIMSVKGACNANRKYG